MRLELIRVGLPVKLTNHCTTRGDKVIADSASNRKSVCQTKLRKGILSYL